MLIISLFSTLLIHICPLTNGMLSVTFIGLWVFSEKLQCLWRPISMLACIQILMHRGTELEQREHSQTLARPIPLYCLFCLVLLRTKIRNSNSTFNCQRNNNNRAHTQGLNEIVNTSWRKTVDIDFYIYIYMWPCYLKLFSTRIFQTNCKLIPTWFRFKHTHE